LPDVIFIIHHFVFKFVFTLNPGLPSQKQHSTGRRLFSPTKWT